MPIRWRLAMLPACALLASALLACDDKASPAAATATPSQAASSTAAATTPPPSATATRAASPTPTASPAPQKAAGEGPRVLSILRDHSGAGVYTFHIVTDVPTRALLRAVGRVGAPLPEIEDQDDQTLAKEHTISIPAGQDVYYAVDVVDGSGGKGIGAHEEGDVITSQYWGRNEFAPKLTMDGGRKATITWANLRGDSSAPPPGTVQLFAKKGGCTTAEACPATLVGMFGADTVGGDLVSATHKVQITFPPGTDDYQVIVTGATLVDRTGFTQAHFYEFDVAAGDIK